MSKRTKRMKKKRMEWFRLQDTLQVGCLPSFFVVPGSLTSSGALSEDLAGMKVRHGLSKVLEGGAVVLTLKDSGILKDGDLNEGGNLFVGLMSVWLWKSNTSVPRGR